MTRRSSDRHPSRVLLHRDHRRRRVARLDPLSRPCLDRLLLPPDLLHYYTPYYISNYPGPDDYCPFCGQELLAGLPAAHSHHRNAPQLYICTACKSGLDLINFPEPKHDPVT